MRLAVIGIVAAVCLMRCGTQAQPGSGASNTGNTSDRINSDMCVALENGTMVVCDFPAPMRFTGTLGDQLIQHMPDKKRLLLLDTIGADLDQSIGMQVEKFLFAHGYKPQRRKVLMRMPPPDYPLTLKVSRTQYTVTVAPKPD